MIVGISKSFPSALVVLRFDATVLKRPEFPEPWPPLLSAGGRSRWLTQRMTSEQSPYWGGINGTALLRNKLGARKRRGDNPANDCFSLI